MEHVWHNRSIHYQSKQQLEASNNEEVEFKVNQSEQSITLIRPFTSGYTFSRMITGEVDRTNTIIRHHENLKAYLY